MFDLEILVKFIYTVPTSRKLRLSRCIRKRNMVEKYPEREFTKHVCSTKHQSILSRDLGKKICEERNVKEKQTDE